MKRQEPPLDPNPVSDPLRVDHIGVDIWQAYKAYEAAMFDAVAENGFADISVADSDVLVFVSLDGVQLVEIARQRRISKQAAHEQVHGLIRRGYLCLEDDPRDRRAKIVRHTGKGLDLVRALVDIKRALHDKVRTELGEDGLQSLTDMLSKIRQVV